MKLCQSIILCCLCLLGYGQSDTITWTQLSPLPDGVQHLGSAYFIIDSNFYVAGGQEGGGNNSINSVWRYHIPSDTWFRMNNLSWGSSICAASFVLGGKGYFLTSRDSVNSGDCDTLFWEYNPQMDSWIKKANFPDNPRQASSYFNFNNIGYVAQTAGCNAEDSHLWKYDPAINKWTQLNSLPNSILVGGSTAVIGLSSSAYLFGGFDIGNNFSQDIWEYNIILNQWTNAGVIPGLNRSYSIFWQFDSVIIGGGGEVSDNNSILNLGSDFYSYNIYTNSWTPVIFKNSFDSTAAGATFVYNQKAYYFGGFRSLVPFSFSNRMWSFDASKYIHDTSVGIREVSGEPAFSVYPNPASHSSAFSISSSESGDVIFYDALGRMIDERRLIQGTNAIRLATSEEVIFYRATLRSGTSENGRIVFIR